MLETLTKKNPVTSFLPKNLFENLLKEADIQVNGTRPWDIQIHDQDVYRRVFLHGSLGFGEAYVAGQWDAERVDEFIARALNANLDKKVNRLVGTFSTLTGQIMNMQLMKSAMRVADVHYNLSNDLFKHMLDKNLVYTCGYWKWAKSLDEAQEHKLDLICQKLQLRPGMTILDIGCGWGSFMKYAAENYGVHVTGVTISREQVDYIKKYNSHPNTKVILKDYRLLTGEYDRVVSVGMFEHVGHKNYNEFMKICADSLNDEGIFLLHTIGGNRPAFSTDPWIEKYIFPGGMIPSPSQLTKAVEKYFVIEDWHNFGPDYDKTLMAWHKNFEDHWKELPPQFDETFYRIWRYYLLSCAATFRARKNQLWQLLLTKKGTPGGLASIR